MMRLAGGLIFVLVAVISLGWFFMSQPWSGSAEPAPIEKAPREPFTSEKAPREGFASARDNGFDGRRAMGYLEEICRIGPRLSGSDAMKRQQDLLIKHFEAHGGKVLVQRFTARQKSQLQTTEMANLIVSWDPDKP